MRRCALEGVDAVLRRRGADEAGSIFISVDRLDGRADLLGPAPQVWVPDGEVDRLFAVVLSERPPLEIEERMRREIRFDPDLWWIGIDDRQGRSLVTPVTGEPAP
nr:DUF1491 family protein [Enterovirga sp. DB1703]